MADKTSDAITLLATNYVEQRDAYANRFRNSGGLVAMSETKQADFVALIEGFANQLGAVLPPLTLVQLEGLSELVNSRLNLTRRIEQGAKP